MPWGFLQASPDFYQKISMELFLSVQIQVVVELEIGLPCMGEMLRSNSHTTKKDSKDSED